MVSEFCNILESFGFMQNINGATHVHGHTLDLILSNGVAVEDVNIEDVSFSDHSPIVFNVHAENSAVMGKHLGYYSRCINSSVPPRFSEIYHANAVEGSILNAVESSIGPDKLTSLLYTNCSNILDVIAPFKLKSPRQKSYYWLDDNARSLRRACRQAERKWKQDSLTVSCEFFKECLFNFQKVAKSARSKYFSDLINTHSHRPKILFSTINSIINPGCQFHVGPSTERCEFFTVFFR